MEVLEILKTFIYGIGRLAIRPIFLLLILLLGGAFSISPGSELSSTSTAGSTRYTVTSLSYQANGINPTGQVVGYNNQNNQAFRFTPTKPNGTSGTLVNLGTLGGTVSLAEAINGSGQVVGYSTLADGTYRAFLYSNGRLYNIGTLGAAYGVGYGINASGQVVGSSYTKANLDHAFLWTPSTPNGTSGKMIDLGTLGGQSSSAYGVNKNGEAVGYAYRSDGNFRAFLYSNGTMKDLGTLGGDWSRADGMNDADQIVGQAYLRANVSAHACLWQNGTIKDLGTLGGTYSEAYGINSSGSQIVGYSDVPSNSGYLVSHAFLYSNGVMQDLNKSIPANSGWVLAQATGVNDAGQIVGYGTLNGQQKGFLLTPQ